MRASLLSVLLMLLPLAVLAQEPGLYEGGVMVTSQDAEERAAVLPDALAQVLGKLTGDPGAARGGELTPARAEAARLLHSFRYREERGSDGSRRLLLVARFDQAGVDALLADAGAMVWPAPRPPLLAWLSIDDGRGPRLVASAQGSALAPMRDRARQRGLDLVLPLLDLEDQSQVDAAAVRALDPAPVAAASMRYRTPLVLMGRLERGARDWRASWLVLDRGQVVTGFEGSDPDPTVLMAEAADRAAGALAARYASPLLRGQAEDLRVRIAGLAGAEDYARALGYLRGLAVVAAADAVGAGDGALELRLGLRTSREGLLRLLDQGEVMEVEDASADAPRLRLKP